METTTFNNLLEFTKKLTLLYVEEDNKTIASNLKLLERYFDEIIIAKNGQEGIEKFKNHAIDIVITEINLPLLNGMELLKQIKEINKNTLTIILSKENNSEIFVETINLGIDGYIIKPFNDLQFKKILERSIEQYIINEKNKSNINDINLLNQYQEIVNKSTIVSKTDHRGIITYANKNFCKASEYSRTELIGKNHNIVRHPDNPTELFKDLWKTIKERKQEWNGIIKNRSKSGKSYYVKSTITPVLDERGNIIEYVGVRNAISSIMSDKKYLIDKIASSELSLLVLIQIEEFEILDKFYNIKTLNKLENTFGLELLSYLPNGYIFENIYNIGNGKFALLTDFFNYLSSEQNIITYLEEFVKAVKKSILTIDEIEYDLNIVVSYSFGKENLYEDAKCGLDEVIIKKDLIKYANDSSIQEHLKAKKNMEVIKMVKIALDNYNIVSHFQPIINNKTQKIAKYESLVRLIDEEGKVLSPYHFLEVSKKGNYYNKITSRVLENSFKMLNHISTQLSINISSIDIEKEKTRNKIFELLSEYKSDAHRVVFELLEDEEVKDFKIIKDFIKTVKKLGVQIAIDDFGAGYSNFERLLEFEPDILKIDGSLIKNIAIDTYSRNVVETIVDFAKKQNIETIAEFVENEEIFDILNIIGVDYSQGYYFGKPENLN